MVDNMLFRFSNFLLIVTLSITTSSHCCLSKQFPTVDVAAAAATRDPRSTAVHIIDDDDEVWKWDLPYLLQIDAAGDSKWVSRCESNNNNHQEELVALFSSFDDNRTTLLEDDDYYWVSILDESHASLKEELLNIPTSELYMPYCHNDNNYCDNDPSSSWQIFPLMIMNYKVTTNLAMFPVVSNVIEKLIQNIPGLISVGISLSKRGGHIKPHIDSGEGETFIRYLYGISVPLPHARINVCGNKVYEFSDKTLFSFNNSKPHEVINPSSSSRIVLVIDVLLRDIYSNESLKKKKMNSLIENEWDSALTFLKNYDKKNNSKILTLRGTNINLNHQESSSILTTSSSSSTTLSTEEQFWEKGFKGREWISNEGRQYRLKSFSWSRDSEYTDWYRVGEFREVRNGVEQKRQYSLSVSVLKKTKWLSP
jgi:hypothetical protein